MPLRLLKTDDTEELQFDDVVDESLITNASEDRSGRRSCYRYVILSHRWRDEEVVYADRTNLAAAKAKAGWKKLARFKELARENGYTHLWIDTLCINKDSSTELAEALNSMYKGYEKADLCYAYLDDVHNLWHADDEPPACMLDKPNRADTLPGVTKSADDSSGSSEEEEEEADVRRFNFRPKKLKRARTVIDETIIEAAELGAYRPLLPSDQKWDCLVRSQWFTRGWTLQEMIAPTNLRFYNADWTVIRDRKSIAKLIAIFTGVDEALLTGKRSLHYYSVAQKLSWAAQRQTLRVEDRAYSLFGLLGVRIPIQYGEGPDAFKRLQEQLLVSSTDTTISAWQIKKVSEKDTKQAALLADSIDAFQHCGRIAAVSATAQQQRFQSIGGQMLRFDAYVYQSRGLSGNTSDGGKVNIVVGCVATSQHKLLTLSLERDYADDGAYRVALTTGAKRLTHKDLYSAENIEQTRSFDIWHSSDDIQIQDDEDKEQKIFLRYRRTQRLSFQIRDFYPLSATPAEDWDSERWAFVWSEDQTYGDFKGVIHLTWGITLIVYKKLNGPVTITFRPGFFDWLFEDMPFGSWIEDHMFWLLEPTSTSAIRSVDNYYLAASAEERMMLQHKEHFVELELSDASHIAISNCLGALNLLTSLIICVAAAVPALLTALPLLLVIGQRYHQSDDFLSLIRGGDWAFIVLGILAGLPAVVALFFFFIWRTERLYQDEARYKGPFLVTIEGMIVFYLVLRQGYWWVGSAMSIILCARYLSWAWYDRGILASAGAGSFQDPGIDLGEQHKTSWAIEVRLAFAAFTFLLPCFPLDFLRLCFATISVVPLLLSLTATSVSTFPYKELDCYGGNVTAEDWQFYTQYSDIAGWDWISTCDHFALEGGLAWAIAGLTIVEGVLALIAWLCLRSRHPAENYLMKKAMFALLYLPMLLVRFIKFCWKKTIGRFSKDVKLGRQTTLPRDEATRMLGSDA